MRSPNWQNTARGFGPSSYLPRVIYRPIPRPSISQNFALTCPTKETPSPAPMSRAFCSGFLLVSRGPPNPIGQPHYGFLLTLDHFAPKQKTKIEWDLQLPLPPEHHPPLRILPTNMV